MNKTIALILLSCAGIVGVFILGLLALGFDSFFLPRYDALETKRQQESQQHIDGVKARLTEYKDRYCEAKRKEDLESMATYAQQTADEVKSLSSLDRLGDQTQVLRQFVDAINNKTEVPCPGN